MISAFSAAGHRVFILTGVEADEVTPEDVERKTEYLTSMGVSSDLYVELVVSPRPHDVEKAREIKDKDIAMLFDNSVANVKKASKLCIAWLLWNAREKD